MDSLRRRAGSSVAAVGTELQVCITAMGEHDVSSSRSHEGPYVSLSRKDVVPSYSGSNILVKPSKWAGNLPQRAMGIRDMVVLRWLVYGLFVQIDRYQSSRIEKSACCVDKVDASKTRRLELILLISTWLRSSPRLRIRLAIPV